MWYVALYGMFALWVLLDGLARRIGASVAAWTVGTLLLGPIVLPVYLTKRPLKKGEVREGGTAWNVLKNFAILWTVLMAIAGFGALMNMGQAVSSLDSDAARAGAGLGMLFGIGFLAVVAVVIIMVVARTGAKSVTTSTSGGHPETAPATWTVDEKVNAMDETKKTVLSLRSQDEVEGYIGRHAAFLIIKCEKGKSEAYVSVGTQIQHEYGSERYGVRVKFDDSNAVKQHWDASTDGTALFSPSPGELVRELEGAKVFLFEFTPFQKTPTIVTFNVSGLSEKLTPISDACGLATTTSQR